MRFMPGGGMTSRLRAARTDISLAYQLQGYFQIANAPDWIANSYYDIQAKPASAATREETFRMLQALWHDRFRLGAHREERQVDGYTLTMVRSGRSDPSRRSRCSSTT